MLKYGYRYIEDIFFILLFVMKGCIKMKKTKFKNKIITISGQPVTGKGTTVKALVDKLKEMGYTEKQIHLEETGHRFREYFEKIIELLQNINDKEKAEELSRDESLKLVLSNEKNRKQLIEAATKLATQGVDIGNLDIAQYNQLEELSNVRKMVDYLIDDGIKTKFEKINQTSMPNDIWIVDSRLAFHNIPESFSVRLICDPDIAAQRLLNDTKRGKEDNKYKSLEEAKQARERRRIGENERYKRRYDVDLENSDNYNLIIDTSYSTVDDISDVILKCLECEKKQYNYAKTWTSPKRFLPMQKITLTDGRAKYTLNELEELISKNGYDPSEPIEVFEVDKMMAISEGHHRNFAMALLNKTLIPYEIIARDDEYMPGREITARKMFSGLNLSDIYDHEDGFKKWDPSFSYEDIYPNLYQKIKESQKDIDFHER